MQITKIEKQKKIKQRYNIHIDNEFAFGIYEDTLVKFGLRSGDILEDALIAKIKKSDEISFGKKVAYSYLSYKPRSRKEIEKKLMEKKISKNSIEDIIAILEEQNYINDENYARNFLDNKILSKPAGRRLMMIKLQEKGIGKETAEDILKKVYSGSKESDLAQSVLLKYEKKVKYKNEADRKNKCYRYLSARGFDNEVIKQLLQAPD